MNKNNVAKIIPIVKPKSPMSLKPATRSSKAKKIHTPITATSELIDRVGELNQQKKDIEAEYRLALTELQGHFSEQVVNAESDGQVLTTLACEGDEYKYKMTRKNQYSKIDMSESDALMSALGDDVFFGLVVERADVKMAPDVDVELLESILMEAGHDPNDFFSTRQYLTLHNDTIERSANLRGVVSAATMSYVDELVGSLQYKPSISAVKLKK